MCYLCKVGLKVLLLSFKLRHLRNQGLIELGKGTHLGGHKVVVRSGV